MQRYLQDIILVLLFVGRVYALQEDAKGLVDKAWEAYIGKDYSGCVELVDECIKFYEKEARAQHKNLKQILGLGEAEKYNVLDSVITARFIQAEIARLQNKPEIAIKMYKGIIEDYPYGYCWDWVGNLFVAETLCKSRIKDIREGNLFGDYTSKVLLSKAWQALGKKDYVLAESFTKRCIELYEKKALKEQEGLTEILVGKDIKKYQFLNDVGSCQVILAEVYREKGEIEKAKAQYKKVIEEYPYSQCWDPRGWYWSVRRLAEDRLFCIEKGINLFDSSSSSLTSNAWKSLEKKDYEMAEFFARHCVNLYSDVARSQQEEVGKYPKGRFIPYYWALNDVGTCYFILGEVYLRKKNYSSAKEMYKMVVDEFSFSQCWDPRGWFWKVSEVCKKRLKIRVLQEL